MHKILKATIISSLLLFSCDKVEHHLTQHIRLNISSEPPSLDPRRPSDTSSVTILSMCFDGLMRRDKEGKISPSIAERFDISEDGRVYTFYLKKTLWSDGEPLMAQDFEASIKMILSPSFPSEFASDLYVVKNAKKAKEGNLQEAMIGVSSIDDYTLRIELESAIPYFLDMLASHSFYPIPRHKLVNEGSTPYRGAEDFVCNGPFRITKWKHHNKIELEKNRYYYDKDRVILEKIDLFIVENDTTQLSMFENKEIDWIGSPLSSLPTDALSTLSQRDDFHSYPVCGTYYYIFNTKVYPFDNIHMRKALCLSIDRKQIIDNILQGKQLVATSLIPPTLQSVFQNLFTDADTATARNELSLALSEMNIQLKDLPKIKLSYNSNSAHHIIAQAIQQQWYETLGIDVELENMEWKVFLDHLTSGSFQIARMGGLASFNDPTSFLKDFQYPEARVNQSNWGSDEFSRLLDMSDKTSAKNERDTLLKQAEQILIASMPIAPIYFYTGSYLKNEDLVDVTISDLGEIDFKYAYKKAHEKLSH